MIEVKPYLLYLQSRQKILHSFWETRPAGTAEEINATARKVETESTKIQHTVDQLRQYPKSGQIKGGERRRIVVSDSRYVITYQISRNRKRLFLLNIRDGARTPRKPLFPARGPSTDQPPQGLTPEMKSWIDDVIVPALIRKYLK